MLITGYFAAILKMRTLYVNGFIHYEIKKMAVQGVETQYYWKAYMQISKRHSNKLIKPCQI